MRLWSRRGTRPAAGRPKTPRCIRAGRRDASECLQFAVEPIFLLYGGQDQTVNPAANCELFVERFKAAGGEIQVENRRLFGHHPHGLDPNKTAPIVEFFEATESHL